MVRCQTTKIVPISNGTRLVFTSAHNIFMTLWWILTSSFNKLTSVRPHTWRICIGEPLRPTILVKNGHGSEWGRAVGHFQTEMHFLSFVSRLSSPRLHTLTTTLYSTKTEDESELLKRVNNKLHRLQIEPLCEWEYEISALFIRNLISSSPEQQSKYRQCVYMRDKHLHQFLISLFQHTHSNKHCR